MSYKLIKHLGSGAFGSVDQCETPAWEPFYNEHPVVAIKRVKYTGAHAEKEAEILRRLNHEGCVKLLASFRDTKNGDLCLVQEFCDMGDLSSGKVTRDEFVVWRIIFQLAGALQYVHSQNILHRDIKPENILMKSVEGSITLKLADFGVSKLMDRVHYGSFYATSRCGTPVYMSPEALDNDQRYGKSSDIWSLGAVISFVCNGSHLFHRFQEVLSWPGGKSTLDRGKYSIELRQLVADMLCPEATSRPRAGQVLTEAQKGEKLNAKETPLQVLGFPNRQRTSFGARLAAPPPASLALGAIPKTSLGANTCTRTSPYDGTDSYVGTNTYSDPSSLSSLLKTNRYGYMGTNPSIETLCNELKHTGIVNYDDDDDDDFDDQTPKSSSGQTEEESFSCELCKRPFSSRQGLFIHFGKLSNHFPCKHKDKGKNTCLKVFETEVKLIKHKKIHK